MPVYSYFDISTAHLTESELDAVQANLPALENAGPRIIAHEYGAWVNVPEIVIPGDTAALVASYPNLARCLARARELGCSWINFDADAAHDGALPTHEW